MKWTFFLMTVALNGDYTVVYDRLDTQVECRNAAQEVKAKFGYSGKIECRHMTLEQLDAELTRTRERALALLRARQ